MQLSVAPMMECTDRHYRYMMRLITKKTLLYTEMVTTGAILNGRGDYLGYNSEEHPLALQLGGDSPTDLAHCAKRAEDLGFDEINLNVGCPSERVQNASFGACLMKEPGLVADCVAAMRAAVKIPVTVKHRIGIEFQKNRDSQYSSYEHMKHFVEEIAKTGCKTFIVHARIAVLGGFSPKQNRDIPALQYKLIYRLKQELPHLNMILNGGIMTLDHAASELNNLDGVMIGRAAYSNPMMFQEADSKFYNSVDQNLGRFEILNLMHEYTQRNQANLYSAHSVARHTLGLFFEQSGSRAFKRFISESMSKNKQNYQILKDASEFLQAKV